MKPEERAREIVRLAGLSPISTVGMNIREAIATALRQSSEEGERRGREEAAKVAEDDGAKMQAAADRAYAAGRHNVRSHRETDVATAERIAAAIRSLNSPTPTNVPNETDR